jgi:uncharacterized surface protein with fasciclin (FAS1) repeats
MSSSLTFKMVLSSIVLAALVATYMSSAGEQHDGTGSSKRESRKLQFTLPGFGSNFASNQFVGGQRPATNENAAILASNSQAAFLASNQFLGQGEFVNPNPGQFINPLQSEPQTAAASAEEQTSAPSAVPTSGSTSGPTVVPTSGPTSGPTPVSIPTAVPTPLDTATPTVGSAASIADPTAGPTVDPTSGPVSVPTAVPTPLVAANPTSGPVAGPTSGPTLDPSAGPTSGPTVIPTAGPVSVPTAVPTPLETANPTSGPAADPTSGPTLDPTAGPTSVPTADPTAGPVSIPTAVPTPLDTTNPTSGPVADPTSGPTLNPTTGPTSVPTADPTAGPVSVPTAVPTPLDTASPTSGPVADPTSGPTLNPTTGPTSVPTAGPTAGPVSVPTAVPTPLDTANPNPGSAASSTSGQKSGPTASPSSGPTAGPTAGPTSNPTVVPTSGPTAGPTAGPTSIPTKGPTSIPTTDPTSIPTTRVPSPGPTAVPTAGPVSVPTTGPTSIPTTGPTSIPTTSVPTSGPTAGPTSVPTTGPTSIPTTGPTSIPTTSVPTSGPTAGPTAGPTTIPTTSVPTSGPTDGPTAGPTSIPTTGPTAIPTTSVPTSVPSARPSLFPTSVPTSAVVENQTVAGSVASNPDLTQLSRAVLRAGFDGILSSDANMFTQFAGTDTAFAAIPENFRFLLFENDEFLPHLRNLLTYNVLMGEIFEADFTDGQILQTFNGETIQVTLNPFSVNGITITDPDNDVSNGVVHVFGGVLTPSWVSNTLINRVQQDSDLSITLEFLELSGITSTINQAASGDFTLLAPTNAAWLALGEATLVVLSDPVNAVLLERALLYHVLDGVFTLQELFPSRITTLEGNFVTVSATPRIRFNQAQLVDGGRDILANNGVLQKIDSVLDFSQRIGGNTVLDFIAERPNISIFFGGLQRSGLAPALASEPALTVFAPTNAAFNALPLNLRQLLFLNDEFIVHLQSLLLYHILPQTIASADFVNNSNLRTANGEFVNILTSPLTVNGRQVQPTDSSSTNGITDTIGGVLLPSWVFNTIASRVENDADLSILFELLALGGINLNPEGALTLLAPNDAAWLALGSDRLSFLRSAAGRDELVQILAFHAGSPIFTANEFGVGVKITTFQGSNTGVVTVTSSNPITFNQVDNALSPAVLVVANILAGNGVVHKIDAVLNPLDSRP